MPRNPYPPFPDDRDLFVGPTHLGSEISGTFAAAVADHYLSTLGFNTFARKDVFDDAYRAYAAC